MKAVEFDRRIGSGGEIIIPREIAEQIPQGEQLRIVVMWQQEAADAAWRSAGRERFESAYCPEDAVYEHLIDDSAAR